MPNCYGISQDDFATALKVLSDHQMSVGDQLGIDEVNLSLDGTIKIQRSAWVVQMAQLFEKKHGTEKGKAITEKVLICLLYGDHKVH